MEHTAGILGLVQGVQKRLSKRTKTERKWKGERVKCVSMERKNSPERRALPEGKEVEGNEHSESKEPKGGQHGWQSWHVSGEVLTMRGEVHRD